MEVKLLNFTTSDLRVIMDVRHLDKSIDFKTYFDHTNIPFEDFARSINQIKQDFNLESNTYASSQRQWRIELYRRAASFADIAFMIEIEPDSYIQDAVSSLIRKCGTWK